MFLIYFIIVFKSVIEKKEKKYKIIIEALFY